MSELLNKVKTFWNNRPCNIKHSKKEIGTLEYFEEVRQKKYFVEPHILKFAEHSKYKGKRVLELGCGIGTDSIEFAKHGAIIDVMDISKKSLDICRKRFSVYNLQANFYESNIEKLDTIIPKKNYYDLIYAFGSIHHSPNPSEIIKNVYQLLKKGGEFKLMVYNKYSFKLFDIMKELNEWDFSKINEIIPKYSEAQQNCPITYSYTKNRLSKLLHSFTIQTIYKDHIFPYKIPEYLQNIYIKRDFCKNMSDSDFKELEQEMGWHYLCICTKD